METDGRQRDRIAPGDTVGIVQKKDQRNGSITEGRVQEILTRSRSHPHGIKVRLIDGHVGRVRYVKRE
ncbi:MAG: hypothetical protein APR55_09385 [Methanolinea sp. SDB]|nr:MAG: hypothetical protein APR55_09385 [Methanolinea sp. SDB]